MAKVRLRACFDRNFGSAYDYVIKQNGASERVFLLGISIGAVAAIVFAGRDAKSLIKASSNKQDEIWIVDGAGHSLAYKTKSEEYIYKVAAFFSRSSLTGD